MTTDYTNLLMQQTRSTMSNDGLNFSIVDITPELAAAMLGRNTNNRRLKKGGVAAYESDMLNDDWVFTGDPIRFHENGQMIDGQHRLNAISRQHNGFALRTLVIFGLGDDAQLRMDQGSKRTAADQLTIDLGMANATLVAGAAKKIIQYEEGLFFSEGAAIAARATISRIHEWVKENEDKVDLIHSVAQDIQKSGIQPSILAAVAAIASELDGDLARDFVSGLATGAGQEEGSPILALRSRVMSNKINRRKETEKDMFGLVATTWNRWVQNKKIGKLQLPVGGTYSSRNFPVVYVGE